MTRSLNEVRRFLTRESRERWGASRTEALRPVLDQTAREVHAVEQCAIPPDEEPLYHPPSHPDPQEAEGRA